MRCAGAYAEICCRHHAPRSTQHAAIPKLKISRRWRPAARLLVEYIVRYLHVPFSMLYSVPEPNILCLLCSGIRYVGGAHELSTLWSHCASRHRHTATPAMLFAGGASVSNADSALQPMSMWRPTCWSSRAMGAASRSTARSCSRGSRWRRPSGPSAGRPSSTWWIRSWIAPGPWACGDALQAHWRPGAGSSRQLDQVAYIRFASVYLNFHDLAEVRTEIDRLMGRLGGTVAA